VVDRSGPCDYDDEVRRHDEVLRRAYGVQPHEHVLDIGCGLGQTTREAARMAQAGSAFGVDISAPAIELARELARAQGISNVTFERADAQVHRFPQGRFDVVISRFGTLAALAAVAAAGPDPFSLGDPPTVTGILEAAGFAEVTFTDVHEPVYYGPDVAAALDWVRGFVCTREVLDRLDPAGAASALGRLREMLGAHLSDNGVWFDSRAWIVAACRQ